MKSKKIKIENNSKNEEIKKQILEIKNLTKYYGNILAVDNLSLSLNKGEVFGFIGPNGAGKSTTIRSIMNLINKTKGKILINGKEFKKDDIIRKVLGEDLSRKYLKAKEKEYEDYQSSISEWELNRYLHII